MSKVWVTQESDHDFLPAEKFGEIIFVTRHDVSNVKGSLTNAALNDEVRFKMQKFDSDHDFVVIAGSPYVAAVVFYQLGARKVPFLRLLRWSNRDKAYQPVQLDMRNGNG